MRNFSGYKALKDISHDDLSVGTAFELVLDNLPVRRGVVCHISPLRLAWFISKSASAENLFEVDADFSREDKARLWVRAVPRYQDFIGQVPGKVRARGGDEGAKKRNKKDSHGDPSNEDLINPDLFVSVPQAHVPQVRTPGSFFVSMRPAILAPVCSPPVTPRAAKKPKNSTRTLTSVVQELSEGVQELKVHLLKMSRRIKKLRHRVKMFSAKPALLHGGGQDTWDTS